MKINDFYNEVARRADTAGTKISVAETRRVLSVAFLVLAEHTAPEVLDVVAKGLAGAAKKLANSLDDDDDAETETKAAE